MILSKSNTFVNVHMLTRHRFGDAVIELTRKSLVTRVSASKALCMHRLVQQTVFTRLSPDQRLFYMGRVIEMLSSDFPNIWNCRGPYQGHGYKDWETCGIVLPHISQLMKLTKDHGLRPEKSWHLGRARLPSWNVCTSLPLSRV